MAKRDKLYTVNKWNKPFFEEERRKKLFLWGGDSLGIKPGLNEGLAGMRWGYGNTWGSDYVAPVSSLTKLNSIDRAVKDFNQYSNPSYWLNLARTQYVEGDDKPLYGSSVINDTSSTGTTITDTKPLYNTNWLDSVSKITNAAGNIANGIKATKTIAQQQAELNPIKAGGISSLGKAGINLAAGVAGELGKRYISNGFHTTAGDAIDTVGSTASTILPLIPGVGWAAAPIVLGASKLLSGVANAAFGSETYDNGATAYTNRLNSLNPNGSNEYLANLLASTGIGPRATYRDGWLRDKGENEAAAINNAQDLALTRFQRGVRDAFANNNTRQLWNAYNDYVTYGAMGGKLNKCKCNKKSYGGYLDSATPTGFNFLSDMVNIQEQKNQIQQDGGTSLGNSFMGIDGNPFAAGGSIHINPAHKGQFTAKAKRHGMGVQQFANHVLAHKDKFPTSTVRQAVFAKNSRTWQKAFGGKLNYGKDQDIRNNSFFNGATLYELGGILQAGGSNWGDVVEIGAGGTHSENPYQGVQVGVDPEGTPNLVEENEVIYNDYVFSNRIKVPKEICKALRIGMKKDGFTFAEAAKKLTKESKERPNDPISKKALEANMQKLEDYQEEIKQKMEAEKAVEDFNNLPPEQQVAIMNLEGQRAQDAVAQELMQQEFNNLPPEQQQAIAQQIMAEQAATQGLGVPQGQPSPEEQAMMQQQMAQQQGINPQEAIAQASAMQQQALAGMALGGKLCFGGRRFAEGGELNGEQPVEQPNNEMAKYSDEELQDMIDDYQEAESGEVKVTKGKLARLKKKAEKAEAELERRHAEENEEQPLEVRQEPSQEELQTAAQAQAMQTQQPIEGQSQEGMSPEQAMMMQQQMGGQPQMSPEEMAAAELLQLGNGQYAYGGKLYLTGGELVKALGFKSTKDLPFTLKDLGINDWSDEVNPQNVKSIYSKVTDPIVKHLIKNGWNPFDSVLNNPDRWFENSAGEAINWGDAGQFKTQGYSEDVLKAMAKRYPHIKYALEHGLKDHDFSKGNVKREDLFKAISEAPEWKETEQYLYDPTNGLSRRLEYIARRRGIDQNGSDKKFLNKWNNFGEFKLGDDGKYTYTLKDGKQADFDAAFKAAREDGLIGTMYDVRVPATTKAYRYMLDENGNPTDDVLFDTTGYEQVGSPYSYYTLGEDGTFNPNINNEITYWRPKTNSGNSIDNAESTNGESNYLTVGWKPKTDWTGLALGVAPGLTGLAMQLGRGAPDMSELDKAVAAYERNTGTMVAPHLTHGLIRPAIIDPRVTENNLNARRLGTNRLLMNTGSTPSRGATILANDANTIGQLGQAMINNWRENRQQEQAAAAFNRETNTTNANILNQVDQFNAQTQSALARDAAQLRYNVAKDKIAARDAYYAGLMGNLGSVFKGGYEAWRENQRKNERDLLAASGVFGETNNMIDDWLGISKVDPKTHKVVRGYNTGMYYWINPNTGKAEYLKTPPLATNTINACGGKIKKNKKRKGYTF